jgi:alpha-glucosidase (family GH31 glycosyl hydrolase)
VITKGALERDVYLPEGKWLNLLTDEVIEGGTTVTAQANLGQIPVFLNMDSADADELRAVFASQNWKEIKNHK